MAVSVSRGGIRGSTRRIVSTVKASGDSRAVGRIRFGPSITVLLNKYYVDELYDALIVNRAKNLGNGFLRPSITSVIDGGVNGSAWLTRTTAEGTRRWDIWVIDGFVNLMAFMVRLMSYPVRMVQTGLVQSYALMIVLGLLGFVAYYLVRG